MKRKEAIIRYLGHVERGDRHQIAEAIGATPLVVSPLLTRLKQVGVVRNVEWQDGSKVWILTAEGERRFMYYVERDRKRRRG